MPGTMDDSNQTKNPEEENIPDVNTEKTEEQLSDLMEEGEYQENFNEEVDGQDFGDFEDAPYEEEKDEDDEENGEEGSENDRKIRREARKHPPVKKPKKQASPAREWLSDNLRYILLILAIAAVVVIIFILAKGVSRAADRGKTGGAASASETLAANSVSASAVEKGGLAIVSESEAAKADEAVSTTSSSGEESVTASASEAVSAASEGQEEEGLAEADADVTSAVTAYFTSLQGAETNELIESYSNIKCYTYPGKNEGTYIVFATADYKYKNFAETIPSLSEFYLAPGSDGKLAVVENTSDSDQEYMSEIEARPEVQKLIEEVSGQYDKVVGANPDLKAYIEGLN